MSLWTTARIVELERLPFRLVRLRLDVADRVDHVPGQHYVVRLRAPDGYTAQRSYSVASDPADPLVELMVEALPDGEVSGHLHDVAEPGDVVEVRGPIGGWFAWSGEVTALAIGGGTGVVPLVAMLRLAGRRDLSDRLRVVAVGRTLDELPYAEELIAAGAFVALTRENLTAPGQRLRGPGTGGEVEETRADRRASGGVTGASRNRSRVAAPPYPEEVATLAEGAERAYVCGSVGFASYAQRLLGEVGIRADTIRVEQFGATG